MDYEIVEAAQRTTAEENLSAIKSCVSNIRQSAASDQHEIHENLDLIDDALTVIRIQLEPRSSIVTSIRKSTRIWIQHTDDFFIRHTKLYYSVIAGIIASFMLLWSIIAV